MRALLLAVFLIPSLAWAQTEDDQNFPRLRVNSTLAIEADISLFSFLYPASIPIPPYALPDTSASLVIGGTLFQRITTEGDTVRAGVLYEDVSVEGPVELARDASGAPALGCVEENGAESDIANSLEGRIGLIARGRCAFIHKVAHACRAGAIGVIIYNPPDRVPDVIGNMTTPEGYRGDAVTIPAVLLPWSMARPIVEAQQSLIPVEATISEATHGEDECFPFGCFHRQSTPDACGLTVSVDPAVPDSEEVVVRVSGPNPVHGSARITLSVPSPQSVRVEAFTALGRRVAVLHDGPAAGTLTLSLDTRELSPGVYLVRATAGDETQVLRLTVAR